MLIKYDTLMQESVNMLKCKTVLKHGQKEHCIVEKIWCFPDMEEAESSFVYFKPKVGPCVKVCLTGKGAVYR